MDHLSENFGRLTTTAREWTPQNIQTQPPPPPPQVERTGSSDWGQVESELNAASVKEFVPGRGWTTSGTSTNTSQQKNPSTPATPPRQGAPDSILFLLVICLFK